VLQSLLEEAQRGLLDTTTADEPGAYYDAVKPG
jgi:hypothetical protein